MKRSNRYRVSRLNDIKACLKYYWKRFRFALRTWNDYNQIRYVSPSYFGLSSTHIGETWKHCGNWKKLCHLCRDTHCQFAGGFNADELGYNELVRYKWWRPITTRYFRVGQLQARRMLLKYADRPPWISQQLLDYVLKLQFEIRTWDRPWDKRGEEWSEEDLKTGEHPDREL